MTLALNTGYKMLCQEGLEQGPSGWIDEYELPHFFTAKYIYRYKTGEACHWFVVLC